MLQLNGGTAMMDEIASVGRKNVICMIMPCRYLMN